MNHVVLLRRHHPRLSSHQAKTTRQSLIHREWITAAAKPAFGETQRSGQRSGLILRTMTVLTNPTIDSFASLQCGIVQIAYETRMIN